MWFEQFKYQFYFGFPAAIIIMSYCEHTKAYPVAAFGIIMLACNFGLVMYNIAEAIKGKK